MFDVLNGKQRLVKNVTNQGGGLNQNDVVMWITRENQKKIDKKTITLISDSKIEPQ